MCGREILVTQVRKIFIEGALLNLCPSCALKVSKKHIQEVISSRPSQEYKRIQQLPKPSIPMMIPTSSKSTRIKTRRISEEFDVVEDYAERIRKAREKLGWSVRVLAEKVKERETTIRRIESGRLKPTIQLAKKLEEVLGIKLLEPILPEDTISSWSKKKTRYIPTLGEVVNIREERKTE